ncbi:hypothetical protein ACF06P_35750 [Streptomyces sp. NPDC015684]|uniref:hypothetical protein n=1 Tax=Streptomyces sp. NPDC015684 TaxID=3364963 RepID=UPI0036FBCFCC
MTAPRPQHLTAGKRTRGRLASELREMARRPVVEVRITPAQYGGGTVWCAMAFGVGRREVPLPGKSRQVAALLREAFPLAAWDRAQDYDVNSGVLREHQVQLPACLEGADR